MMAKLNFQQPLFQYHMILYKSLYYADLMHKKLNVFCFFLVNCDNLYPHSWMNEWMNKRSHFILAGVNYYALTSKNKYNVW